MGFRYQKRINTGKGFGLNVSKSGVSPSFRSRWGSVGTKGFSIRTGIPGLSFRKSYGKGNAGAVLIALLLFGLLYLAVLILWNLVRLVVWCGAWSYWKIRGKEQQPLQ